MRVFFQPSRDSVLAAIMDELMIDESGYLMRMRADGLYFDVC